MTDQTGGWQDDPEVQAALARAHQLTALLYGNAAVADAELAAAGVHPVSVVHGYAETAGDAALIFEALPRLAEAAGGASLSRGGSDYTTYFFDGPGAEETAVGFIAAVSAIAPSWWRVTATAVPVYG